MAPNWTHLATVSETRQHKVYSYFVLTGCWGYGIKEWQRQFDAIPEMREMLAHSVRELRQVKAQRDALLEQLKVAYQWLSVMPKTYAPHHEQMQGIRDVIALTQKEEG